MAFRLIRRMSSNLSRYFFKPKISIDNSPRFVKGMVFPVSMFAIAKCDADNPITATFYLSTESLEHEFLIKQACTVNVNSASQLLTVTLVAIQDTSKNIRESLSHEICLVRQALEWGDQGTPEEHWEKLIDVRGRLADLKHNLRMLNSYMEYAERLARVVAEISFLSGNTAACDALCQRIDQATKACKQELEENHILQTESLDLQKIAITSSAEIGERLKVDDTKDSETRPGKSKRKNT